MPSLPASICDVFRASLPASGLSVLGYDLNYVYLVRSIEDEAHQSASREGVAGFTL